MNLIPNLLFPVHKTFYNFLGCMLVDLKLSTFWLWKKVKQNSNKEDSYVNKPQEILRIAFGKASTQAFLHPQLALL